MRSTDWICKVPQEGKKRPIILVTNITCWRWERMEKWIEKERKEQGQHTPELDIRVVSDSLSQSYSVRPRACGHNASRKSHCLWCWGLRDAIVLLASIQKSLAVEKNNDCLSLWFLIMSVWPLPDPNSPDVSELKEWGQCQGEIRQSEVHPSPSPPPTITNDSASRTGYCIFHSQWLYNSCIIDVVEDMSVAQSVA